MRPTSLLTALVALLPVIAALPATTPLLAPLSTSGDHLEDHYIVVLKKGHNLDTIQTHLNDIDAAHQVDPLSIGGSDNLGGISKIYQPASIDGALHGFYGYAGAFSKSTLELIRSSPEVDYVEHDQIINVDFGHHQAQDRASIGSDSTLLINENPDSFSDSYNITKQLSAPWGLARVSHRPRLTLSTLQRYDYSTASLEPGVDVYVVDTGINVDHVEFQGRAHWGKTIPSGSKDYDGNGHGSHCAGTIGSRAYGVDKGANIWAVKVLSDQGSGTLSDVISGIEWAMTRAAKRAEEAMAEIASTGKTSYKGSIISMSLGGGESKATDEAVNAAAAGSMVAVAAGNDNKDACKYSPAAAKKAITVGASTSGDERAYFSNFGKCVDIFAPGLNIKSVWTGGNRTENVISGTSMATPHVAGLGAYLLGIYGTDTLPYMTAKELAKLNKAAGSFMPEIEAALETAEESTSLIYSMVYSAMPRLAQALLPSPASAFAPIPDSDKLVKYLKPNQLKGLLITLASKGLLEDVGAGSPNLLAFNNATVAARR